MDAREHLDAGRYRTAERMFSRRAGVGAGACGVRMYGGVSEIDAETSYLRCVTCHTAALSPDGPCPFCHSRKGYEVAE